MWTYIACLYTIADAYKYYLITHTAWSFHTWRTWGALIEEADRLASSTPWRA
jgi:hypothetical protein